MNRKDMETMQRALGIIEGIGCGVNDLTRAMLVEAVAMIDDVLDRVTVSDGE